MSNARQKIAVLTSGGDASGMNAAIRSVVRSGLYLGAEVFGIEHGYKGIIEDCFRPFGLSDVGGILDRGGTFLGTSRSEHFRTHEGMAMAADALAARGIDKLVCIGGDGTYRGAKELHERHGISVACLPGTIDNDIAGTDTSIGFDTALNTIAEAVAKVRDTASSHERTFVIEVMGREHGLLALYAGLACGADRILVPEVPWTLESVCDSVTSGVKRGKRHSIIIVAEGAARTMSLAEDISRLCGHEVRTVVLGHVQRGGSPSSFDRILASRMGEHAVRELLAGEECFAVGLRCADTVTYTIDEAIGVRRELPADIAELAEVLAR